MAVLNTLAFYVTATITAVKSFIVQALGARYKTCKTFFSPSLTKRQNKLQRLSVFETVLYFKKC
jgi:hypothetical protein